MYYYIYIFRCFGQLVSQSVSLVVSGRLSASLIFNFQSKVEVAFLLEKRKLGRRRLTAFAHSPLPEPTLLALASSHPFLRKCE